MASATPFQSTGRRAFLRFVLGSPLLFAARRITAAEELTDAIVHCEPDLSPVGELIASAADAINVFDFRAVARRNLSPAHYAFLASGVDHEVGLRANRSGFTKFGLRPRRLVDVRGLDTETEILGTKLACPIVLAPAGMQRAFHPEAEVGVARAARATDTLQILSAASSMDLEAVIEARGDPVWLNLIHTGSWLRSRRLLERAEKAGCSVVVLTVDYQGFGSQDRLRRFRGPGYPFRHEENASCVACHRSSMLPRVGRWLTALGQDPLEIVSDMFTLDWDDVKRLRDSTSMKLVLKGILTGEDAALCVENGVDGVVVSNHGARQIDNSLSSIEVLPEVVRAVAGRIPVLIDSGFRRGTDVFIALALGASAVCVGRPYLWGLAAFGGVGVESVVRLLRSEFETAMRQMGTRDVRSISNDFVRPLASSFNEDRGSRLRGAGASGDL